MGIWAASFHVLGRKNTWFHPKEPRFDNVKCLCCFTTRIKRGADEPPSPKSLPDRSVIGTPLKSATVGPRLPRSPLRPKEETVRAVGLQTFLLPTHEYPRLCRWLPSQVLSGKVPDECWDGGARTWQRGGYLMPYLGAEAYHQILLA